MNAPNTERLRELDALRGIAALIVVGFHYTTEYQHLFGHVQEQAVTVPWGRYGVQLFFVISGFVIFLTLTRAKSFWDFVANRLSRLYPPYWVCILITFIVMTFMPMPGLNVSVTDAALNLTMLQYWLQRPYVDGVYWTLSVELVFYAFVSTLHLCGLLRSVELWMTVWLALILCVHFVVRQGIHLPLLSSPLVRTTFLLEHGHFFFAGVLFYRMKTEGFHPVRWMLLGVCLLAAWHVRDVPHMFSLLISSALFLAFITGHLSWITVTPLLFLGDISYPLYLLHQHIGYAIIARLEKAGFVSELWLVLPIAVALLLATLVNRLVEKPAREWLRGAWKRSALRAQLAGTPRS